MSHQSDSFTDEELIKKFLAGDESAFHTIVERYQILLVNYLFRFTNNKEMAEDITQDTFIAILDNLEKFKLDASFRSWVYAIATNKALNVLRRNSPVYNDEYLQNTVGKAEDPLKNISGQERSIAVQKALGALPERQRAIFILHFYQGLTYEEISIALGCPVGTVKSRVCYALKKLRGILWLHRDGE